jgi:hypothetical protein
MTNSQRAACSRDVPELDEPSVSRCNDEDERAGESSIATVDQELSLSGCSDPVSLSPRHRAWPCDAPRVRYDIGDQEERNGSDRHGPQLGYELRLILSRELSESKFVLRRRHATSRLD